MPRMRFPHLAVVSISLLALALAGCCDECCSKKEPAKTDGPPTVATAWRGSGDTIEVTVWEIHCGGCASEVQDAIAEIEGVTSVVAKTGSHLVTVKIQDPAKRDAIIPKIREAVHSVSKIIVGEDPEPAKTSGA
jgi:copper chaperone CopZ